MTGDLEANGNRPAGFLAAGARDVLVAASQTEHARDVLPQAEPGSSGSRSTRTVTASRWFFTKALVAVADLAIVASCTTELLV